MRVRGIGHQSLTIIVRYAPILVSAVDPDAPAQRGPGLRLSIPLTHYKRQRPKHVRVSVGRFVPPQRIGIPPIKHRKDIQEIQCGII